MYVRFQLDFKIGKKLKSLFELSQMNIKVIIRVIGVHLALIKIHVFL